MEVLGELHGLIRNSRGTLSESELQEVEEFVEGQDFILALETLCGFLLDPNRRVTRDLYVRIQTLCDRLDGVDPYLLESVKASVIE